MPEEMMMAIDPSQQKRAPMKTMKARLDALAQDGVQIGYEVATPGQIQ